MAEIEMEVDMTRPLDFDGHMGDDLIDYDTDMADQRESNSLQTGNLDQAPEDLLDPEDIILDTEHTEHTENHVEQEADAVMSEEIDLGNVEDTMYYVDEVHDDVEQEARPEFHNIEDYHQYTKTQQHGEEEEEEEEEEDYVEISHNLDETAHEADKEQAHQTKDEIDYEVEDHPEQHGLHDDELELDAGGNQEPLEPEDATESAVKDAISLSVEETTTQEVVYARDDDQQEVAEENEITYEEENEEGEQVGKEEEREQEAHEHKPERSGEFEEPGTPEKTLGQKDGMTPTSGTNDSPKSQSDDSQLKGNVTGEDEGDVEDDVAEQGTTNNETTGDAELDEYDVSADVTKEHDDEQEVASQHDDSHLDQNSGAVFDGDFPPITVQYKGDEFPFFSNTSDGFFAETSILDETMGKLLLGLREELVSEICDEDELVFQVDELGLEFAESSWRDSLSSVTLRQILEIFDLLVKNQDPDSTRTLYTYLFTKPCTTKRLEYLIESATAGKGLDEVMHLFEPSIAVVNGVPAATIAAAEDDHAEHLDEYDSPAEETNESDYKQEDKYSAEEGVELNHSDMADENAEEHHKATTQDYNEEDDAEEHHQVTTQDYKEEDDAKPSLADTAQLQDEVFDVDAAEQLDEANVRDESEFNSIVNLEFNREGDEDEVYLEAHDITDDQTQVNLIDTGTTNTSATTMLRDNDETGSIVIDVGADIAAPEPDDTAETNRDDDVGEIDWRDQPEADEETARPVSAAGKRARGDDADVEDEQDAKRRRP